MPAFNPESVYLEPTRSLGINPATGVVTHRDGITVHAKIGARWERLLLLPDEGEAVGELYQRLGQAFADEPDTFPSELFCGRDKARSGD